MCYRVSFGLAFLAHVQRRRAEISYNKPKPAVEADCGGYHIHQY